MKTYIGVDVGGTGIKTGLVDDEGRILYKTTKPTEVERGFKKVIGDICDSIIELLNRARKEELAEPEYIGLGVPGTVDAEKGIVIYAPNLFWENISVKEVISDKINLPVFMDNDANSAAVGEKIWGAGRGISNFVCITLGTGVGAGIIINDKLYRGTFNNAGEVGHITILRDGPQCNCGKKGCLETLVAAPALVKKGIDALKNEKDTLIRDLTLGEPIRVNAKVIFDAAKMGDRVAMDIVKEMAYYLGMGIAGIVNILDPAAIIIGGGVAAAGNFLLSLVEEGFREHCFNRNGRIAKVLLAKLGNDAGIMGAAALGMI